MALLAAQSVGQSGLTPAYAAATGGGDTVKPGDRVFLHVKNGHSSPQTVTVVGKTLCNQGSLHNLVVSVTNAQERMIGPITAERFARAADGLAEITYSGVVSLTIAALQN